MPLGQHPGNDAHVLARRRFAGVDLCPATCSQRPPAFSLSPVGRFLAPRAHSASPLEATRYAVADCPPHNLCGRSQMRSSQRGVTAACISLGAAPPSRDRRRSRDPHRHLVLECCPLRHSPPINVRRCGRRDLRGNPPAAGPPLRCGPWRDASVAWDASGL